MALHLPIGPLNHTLELSLYPDANPVPTHSLVDDVATVSSMLMMILLFYNGLVIKI